MLEKWISLLSSKGYDLVGTSGHIARHESNSNMPMPSLCLHFQALDEQKVKMRDIVVNSYATNSRRWTIYGSGFTGKSPQRYAGFTVVGLSQHEIADYQALEKLLANVKDRNY